MISIGLGPPLWGAMGAHAMHSASGAPQAAFLVALACLALIFSMFILVESERVSDAWRGDRHMAFGRMVRWDKTPDRLASLLTRPTDLEAPEDGALGLIHLAAFQGSTDMARMLLDRGLDPNQSRVLGEGPAPAQTRPLHFVRTPEMASLFLSRGADPDLQGGEGDTALHFACAKGRLEVAMVLMRAGADHTVLNHGGMTALQTARHRGYSVLATHLDAFIAAKAARQALTMASRSVDVLPLA